MPEQTNQRIAKIVIPASEAHSDAPWAASLWAGYFIETAIEEAFYDADELPEDAIRFADLWKYLGEQGNGGHAQYQGNTGGDAASWRRAAELLERIGLSEHRALLEDFIRFSVQNEDRLNDMYAEGEGSAAGELFWGFDDRFEKLEPARDALLAFLREWLLRQSWVEIDQRDEPATMERLRRSISPHPLAEQRRAARRRRLHAENHGALIATVHRLRGVSPS